MVRRVQGQTLAAEGGEDRSEHIFEEGEEDTDELLNLHNADIGKKFGLEDDEEDPDPSPNADLFLRRWSKGVQEQVELLNHENKRSPEQEEQEEEEGGMKRRQPGITPLTVVCDTNVRATEGNKTKGRSRHQKCRWLQLLTSAGLTRGSTVLDIGCGAGEPVSKLLLEYGYTVIGVDTNEAQIDRARSELLISSVASPSSSCSASPLSHQSSEFHCGDICTMEFPEQSFDAVVCLYAITHLPLEKQQSLVQKISRWIRTDGWLLIITGGSTAGAAQEDQGWIRESGRMWWSQADADTYREWILDAGMSIELEEFVAEGDGGGHELFLAKRTRAE